MLDLLFPFDDKLLCDYTRKSISSDDRKRFTVVSIGMIAGSLLFIFIGVAPELAKVILVCPLIIGSIFSVCLIYLSRDEKKAYLGIILSVLGISSFTMAIPLLLSTSELTVQKASHLMRYAAPIYLVLLIVGYRIHYYYQLKNGGVYEKVPWNSSYTAIAVVLGISISKAMPRSVVVFVLWLIWSAVHIALSAVVLEYRKFCRCSENS